MDRATGPIATGIGGIFAIGDVAVSGPESLGGIASVILALVALAKAIEVGIKTYFEWRIRYLEREHALKDTDAPEVSPASETEAPSGPGSDTGSPGEGEVLPERPLAVVPADVPAS